MDVFLSSFDHPIPMCRWYMDELAMNSRIKLNFDVFRHMRILPPYAPLENLLVGAASMLSHPKPMLRCNQRTGTDFPPRTIPVPRDRGRKSLRHP